MILLVPTSPEVPKYHRPKLWPGLILVLILALVYLETNRVIEQDNEYVKGVIVLVENDRRDWTDEEISTLFQKRPLLRIAPTKEDWDAKRLFYANFLHGGWLHLLLNLIGAFAGARICSSFLGFLATLFIFLVGGSTGIYASMMLSSEPLGYVPHVGASAGIFAMMGAYYVFNFRFRTRYFFWLPTKHGTVALPTSWFFFLDVILLELVLSTAQFSATRLDNVDHLAHVVGFLIGTVLALTMRLIIRWPHYLQTRAELIHWKSRPRPKSYHPLRTPFESWLECLEINPYNDTVKIQLKNLIVDNIESFSPQELERAFHYFSPTFVRAHPKVVASLVKALLSHGKTIPKNWLAKTPYDVIISLAKAMTTPVEEQFLLFKFVDAYRQALPKDSAGFHHKLELLLGRLGGLMKTPVMPPLPQAGTPGTSSKGSPPQQKRASSPPGKGRRVS